ncbi:ABC transporter substrate binding protein [uncultured Microscilla sp.]|uniref:ABC transporter substrate binding protein n=1 Tax=uncultured Microscilla sp. TaxID=432653 RepID=UPI0026309B8B|nr:ABC transporter substrate binding protein [uncultured Microscilla sp.]
MNQYHRFSMNKFELSGLWLLMLVALPIGLQAQNKKPLTIGIVTDGKWAGSERFVQALQNETQALLKNEYEVSFAKQYTLHSQWTAKSIKKNIAQLMQNQAVEVVVGVGPVTSQLLANQTNYPKPTIASTVVNPELQKLPLTKQNTSGVKNFTYLVSPYAPKRDLEVFHQLYPFKKVGILLYDEILKAMPFVKTYFEQKTQQMGVQFELIPTNTSARQALANIGKDIDAIYLGAIFRMSSSEIQQLIQGINDRKLPSFALLGTPDVQRGAMAGIAPPSNPKRISRRVALNIQRSVSGENPANFSVNLSFKERLVINMATVRTIDYYPTWSQLSEAELINEDKQNIARKVNLQQVAEEAIKANLELKVAQQDVASGFTNIRNAQSNLRPRIEVSASGRMIDKDRAAASFGNQPEYATIGSVSFTQVLLSPKAQGNVHVQRQLQQGREHQRQHTRLDVVLQATQSYLNILRAKTLENIQKDNLRLTRRNLELARTRKAVGYSGPSDLYRWESQIALTKKDLIDAQAQLKLAAINLNQLLNRPINEEFVAEEINLKNSSLIVANPAIFNYIDNPKKYQVLADFLVEEGIRNLPEIKQLDAAIAAQKSLRLLTRRQNYTPTIALQAGADYLFYRGGEGVGAPSIVIPSAAGNVNLSDNFSSPDKLNWQVGVKASLPIINGGQRRAELQKNNIEILKMEAQKQDLILKLKQRIMASLALTRAAYSSIQLTQAAEKAASKNFDLVQDAYSKGVVSIIQLIDAQNAAIKSEQFASNAVYEFIIQLLALERAKGSYYFLAPAEQQRDYFNRLETYFKGN